MRAIEVTDEMYDFLVDLSKELNTQNPRGTANPYFFQVMETKKVPAPEDCGDIGWYCDGEVLTDEEDIKNAIFEYKEWEIGNKEHEELFSLMDSWGRDEIMEENYRKVWQTEEQSLANCFLTERACKAHIKSNGYHYSKPVDYLSHAFRSHEFEKVLQFLHEITGGALHK